MPFAPSTHRSSPIARRSHSQELDAKRKQQNNQFYDKTWRMVRARVLREEPVCKCGARTTDVDHILSVRSNPHLRLVRANLRGMCHACHSSRTARDQRGFERKGGADS